MPPAGPNAVSNEWFKAHRNKRIQIRSILNASTFAVGVLVRWDPYAILLRGDSDGPELLVMKGQGMVFQACTTGEANVEQ